MRRTPHVHLATLFGRARTDWVLLLLMGVVVALSAALLAAVAPVTERSADRAIAETVRDAGPRAAVVASLQEWYDDPSNKSRVEESADQLGQDADDALEKLPSTLASVLRPGVRSVTTPALQLLDAGPGRYLQLAYLDSPQGPPAVTYSQGGPPALSSLKPQAEGDPSLVQVAVSQAVADALELEVGDRLPAKDEQGRAVLIDISGTFVADDVDDQSWQVSTRLLSPAEGVAEGIAYASGAALVSAESLPDLRFALPYDDLTRKVVFTPEPTRLTWRGARSLERSIVALQASTALPGREVSWDSQLGTLLEQGRAQVASARGHAQVLIIGLLASALLVLVLAAQLLVRRRRSSLSMTRERGASLPGLATELLLEALVVSVLATVIGVGVIRWVVGSAEWSWSLPVLMVAACAVPVLGVMTVTRLAQARRVPANRSARRAATRALQLRRLGLEAAVAAAAVLSFVALMQRGVVGRDGAGGDVTAASAPTWWAVAGALVVLRVLPPPLRWALRATRRSPGSVAFLVAARLTEVGTRTLPVLLTVVAVAGSTLGVSLAATERDGQAAGALSAVGADARLDVDPSAALRGVGGEVEDAPGVQAVAVGRVEDGARVSSNRGADAVRLVVIDATEYERLLEASDLADAPQLARLRTSEDGRVSGLILGGGSILADGLTLRWQDSAIPVDLVGTAPDVDASLDPVLIVDAEALAGAGAETLPNTVWAIGPGAASALDSAAAAALAGGSVVTYADELDRRRDAALPSALLTLALASATLLLVLAILGIVLAAAAEAPTRGESLGRLRALGLRHRDVRRVLVGELVVPVAVAALAGWLLGLGCSYAVIGSLSLELITGQPEAPAPVLSWWSALAVVILLGAVLVLAGIEWRRVRHRPLAQLLRS